MGLSELFIRVLCIGSVLLYAATATLITKPQTEIASGVIDKLLQIEDNKTSAYEAVSVQDRFLLASIRSRVNSLDSLFRIIGAPQQPLTVAIDRDHPVRVSIGATDVIIGNRAAAAKGQLERSIIKAWIRQVGSSEVLNNPLRVEVYSDLIAALFNGELQLQDPENQKFAQFSGVDNWTDELLGTAQLCDSAWRPAELISYCSGVKHKHANSQTSYSLRNVVGSLIWSDLRALSLLKKRAALIDISRNIRSQQISIATLKQIENEASTEAIQGIEKLRSAIEIEAQEIYPKLASRLPVVVPSVGVLREHQLSLVSGFAIDRSEAPKFKKMIVESCAAPTLKKLLAQTSEITEHILLVQNCENTRVDYSGFAKSGPARFARENLTVMFAYLHRPSLKLAEKMISGFNIQEALAFDSSVSSKDLKNAKFLGLDQKIFREDLGAYKVNGPIGAIEWYRSEKT